VALETPALLATSCIVDISRTQKKKNYLPFYTFPAFCDEFSPAERQREIAITKIKQRCRFLLKS